MVNLRVDGLKITYSKPVSPASIRWNKIDKDTLSIKYTGPADGFCCEVLRGYEIGKASPEEVDEIIALVTDKLVALDKSHSGTVILMH